MRYYEAWAAIANMVSAEQQGEEDNNEKTECPDPTEIADNAIFNAVSKM